ncbi:hypothetical protein D3C86_1388930 [compost metagenome]
MRILLVNAGGIADFHRIEHGQRLFAGFLFRSLEVAQIGFRYLIADPADGIEGEFRILKDHRHAPAANLQHLFLIEREKIEAIEIQPVGGDRRRWQKAQQGAADGGFARAAFTDDTKPFPAKGEGNAPHRLGG